MLLSFQVDIHKLETFIAPIATIVIAFFVSRILSEWVRRYIKRSAGVLKTDPTNYSFVQHTVGMIIFMAAVFFVFWNIPQLHDLGSTLFAGAGILAAIVGFASQEAFSNIISGVFIVVYKPFRVGDNIKLLSNNQAGTVEDITLRHTLIRGAENRRLVVPNSVISREQILNSSLTDERIQLFLEVLIKYSSDHSRALEIMKEEAVKHPLFLDGRNITEKMNGAETVSANIITLEEKGVHLRALVWTKNDGDAYKMKCDLLKILKERFKDQGIELAHDANIS